MTEAEWLVAIHPIELLNHLKRKASTRKRRLLVCACCRRAWGLYTDERHKLAIETIERYCDGEASEDEVTSAGRAAAQAVQPDKPYHEAATATCYETEVKRLGFKLAVEEALDHVAYGISSTEVKSAVGLFLHQPNVEDSERRVQAEFLRDIFGNPFRRTRFDVEWRTSTVVSIAKTVYDSRDFSPMPLLADALQDAGCENEDILNHCRSGGPHVRGCWVVDLILGKE